MKYRSFWERINFSALKNNNKNGPTSGLDLCIWKHTFCNKSVFLSLFYCNSLNNKWKYWSMTTSCPVPYHYGGVAKIRCVFLSVWSLIVPLYNLFRQIAKSLACCMNPASKQNFKHNIFEFKHDGAQRISIFCDRFKLVTCPFCNFWGGAFLHNSMLLLLQKTCDFLGTRLPSWTDPHSV